MAGRDKAAKAAYDRARRVEKREQLLAYDADRNKARRADPVYAAEQVERKKKWRAANRERHLAVSRAYEAKQRAENLHRRIAKNLRHRIRKAMLGETRGVSAVDSLGMSIEEFRNYIEDKFQPGMTWGNYGEWHLDHIHPLKLFDLTDQEQAMRACHHTNLQPLWALDNQKKWCKPHPETWPGYHAAARQALGV